MLKTLGIVFAATGCSKGNGSNHSAPAGGGTWSCPLCARVTSIDEFQACARPSFASGTDGSNPPPSSSESATNCSGIVLRWSRSSVPFTASPRETFITLHQRQWRRALFRIWPFVGPTCNAPDDERDYEVGYGKPPRHSRGRLTGANGPFSSRSSSSASEFVVLSYSAWLRSLSGSA